MAAPAHERVRLARPARWGLLSAVLLIAAAAAYAAPGLLGAPGVGNAVGGGWPAPLLTVSRWLDAVAPVATNTAVRLAVAVALVVAGMLALRRTIGHTRARSPRAVEVRPFTDATLTPTKTLASPPPALPAPPNDLSPQTVVVDASSGPALEVTAHFREALAGLRFPTPTAVPSVSSDHQQGVIQTIKTASEAKTQLGVMAGLAAALSTPTPVVISGILRRRDDPANARYGIAIQVGIAATNSGGAETLWASDWFTAAERAAEYVAAFMLPRTAMSTSPPWSHWHGRRLPTSLFATYREAKQAVEAKCYEGAVSAYYQFLEGDPFNVHVRVEAAQVLEQLNHHLEAVALYADVIALQQWRDARLRRGLSTYFDIPDPDIAPSRRGRGSPDAMIIARYRLACRLCAAGDALASSWSRVEGTDAASAERRNLQQRTTRLLGRYYKSFWDRYNAELELPPTVDNFMTGSPILVRLFLRHVGSELATDLETDYSWKRGRRRPGLPVTQTSMQIVLEWSQIYLRHDQIRVRRLQSNSPGDAADEWPPEPETVKRALNSLIRRKPRRARSWQDYYNAACTMAICLQPVPVSLGKGDATVAAETVKMRRSARAAVAYLELATGTTHSGDAAREGEYVQYGDPDLDELRGTPPFTAFVDRFFPGTGAHRRRPENALTLLLEFHTLRILDAYIERHRASTDVRAAARELQVRAAVGRLARHHREWRARQDLLVDGWANGRQPGIASFPQPDDDPFISKWGDVDEASPPDLDDVFPANLIVRSLRAKEAEEEEVRRRRMLAVVASVLSPANEAVTMNPNGANCQSMPVDLRTQVPGLRTVVEKERTGTEDCQKLWSSIHKIIRKARDGADAPAPEIHLSDGRAEPG